MVIWLTQKEREKMQASHKMLVCLITLMLLCSSANRSLYPVYAYDETLHGNRIYDECCNTVYDFGDGTYSTRMGGFSNQNVAANSGLDVHQTLNDNFNGRG